MTAPREVNAERAMHLRRALEDIRDNPTWRDDAYSIARDAIHDDDIAIENAEMDTALERLNSVVREYGE